MFTLNRKQTKLSSDIEDILVQQVKDDAKPISGAQFIIF